MKQTKVHRLTVREPHEAEIENDDLGIFGYDIMVRFSIGYLKAQVSEVLRRSFK